MTHANATSGSARLKLYDPPGYLTDFDLIPGQRQKWSDAVSGWFDESIASELPVLQGQPCQYINQLKTPPQGPALTQDIVWTGFSGTLRNRWGRAEALRRAELLMPLSERMDGPGSYFVGEQWNGLYYRPQDEYCEWRTTRDEWGRVVRVTFTSEPPEYWQALHGDKLPDMNGKPKYETVGDRELLVERYREFVSPEVEYKDLICSEDLVDHSDPRKPRVVYAKGTYNPYNRWNTVDGIMHLGQPDNTLSAEIQLGADATVLRTTTPAPGRAAPMADPDALIACAGYGGLNRCSDPTIGGSVNELAALGFEITLANPVGLYMDHLEMTGWAGPGGAEVDPAFFRILRGRPGMIERAVLEVPPEEGYSVGDITIGGVPITSGGQVAECVTMKIIGQVSAPKRFTNWAVDCECQKRRCGACADATNPEFLYYRGSEQPCRSGTLPAFDYPQASLATAGRPSEGGR
ncbi:hypothetical protein GCM10010191_03410 [Actinomadura vinacea]|uniref:Uncharacterized protein n=1 Tax=Actinomadura vinacea TaxID=115336 RepID=A0ABN3IAY5_9ACTN